MECTWCGEEDDECWCHNVSEAFKNGESENSYEEPESICKGVKK